MRGITHEEAAFSSEVIDCLGELGLLRDGLKVFEVLLYQWPRESSSEADTSVFRISNDKRERFEHFELKRKLF